jgi:hypothetical protein
MSFTIRSQEDVYKFALPLYDYLTQHGHAPEAKALDEVVDGCFSNNGHALEAHRNAFSQIRETVDDLPDHYQLALNAALGVLTDE